MLFCIDMDTPMTAAHLGPLAVPPESFQLDGLCLPGSALVSLRHLFIDN